MPPFASANLPACLSMAPVNEPFSCPNRIEFDQRLGQRAAIDDDERLAAPIGAALNRARHQFLADAGFAFDQHRNVRLGRPLGEPHGARHQFRAGDNVAKTEFAGVASRRPAQFVLERVDAQRIADRHLKTLGADRLDDKIGRARAHGGDDDLDRAVRGLHDRRNRDIALAHPRQHAHAVEIGHHEVEDDEIDRRSVAGLETRRARLRPNSAVSTSYPNRLAIASSRRRWIGSSSTTSMRAVIVVPKAAFEAAHCATL